MTRQWLFSNGLRARLTNHISSEISHSFVTQISTLDAQGSFKPENHTKVREHKSFDEAEILLKWDSIYIGNYLRRSLADIIPKHIIFLNRNEHYSEY